MTQLEQTPSEWKITEERLEKKLKDLAYFASRRFGDDSSRIHILLRDEESGEKVAAFVSIEDSKIKGTNITFETQGVLPSEETVLEAIDILLKTNPGIPMVCDMSIIDELSGDSLQLVEEGHYQLTRRPNGVLEIYTPKPVSVS